MHTACMNQFCGSPSEESALAHKVRWGRDGKPVQNAIEFPLQWPAPPPESQEYIRPSEQCISHRCMLCNNSRGQNTDKVIFRIEYHDRFGKCFFMLFDSLLDSIFDDFLFLLHHFCRALILR